MTQETVPLLLQLLAVLFVVGIGVLMAGKRVPRGGDWLVALTLFVTFAIAGREAGLFGTDGVQATAWQVGWIWPRGEVGAIVLGVKQDALGLTAAALVFLIGLTLLLMAGLINREARPYRVYAAVAISAAGAAASWLSSTAWLSFIGLGVTLFGGFVSTGSRWDSNPEAAVAARFGWERACGLVLALFGACLLGATPDPAVVTEAGIAGAALVAAGLLMQLSPFPFVGWLMTESEMPLPARVTLTQLFPAWAALAPLVRMEPELRAHGVLQPLGYYVLASATLIVGPGLMNRKPKAGVTAWVAVGLSCVVAALSWAGASAAVPVLLGVSFGGLALAGAAASLDSVEAVNNFANRRRASWSKVACFGAAAAATGGIGFVSVTGRVAWLLAASPDSTALPLVAFVLFLQAFLGWKLAWVVTRPTQATELGWAGVIATLAPVLLSLGVIWTGTLTGGALADNADAVTGSFFHSFLAFPAAPGAADFSTAAWTHWGALVLGLGAAYWTAGRGTDRWEAFSLAMPRFSAFLIKGYGIDRLTQRGVSAMQGLGRTSQWVLDQKLWEEWMPQGFNAVIRVISSATARADAGLSSTLNLGVRRSVDAPARLLQMIQTGDVRWYLMFGIGSGIVFLLHFLRT